MVMGALRQEAQCVVVGAGPGGYVAALRASALGLEVVLVDERERPGGTCLLEGCIPSKALLHATQAAKAAREGEKFGLLVDNIRFDIERLRAFKENVVSRLSKGVEALLRKRKVEVIRGRARFEGPNSLAIMGSEVAGIDFRYGIIATGSKPIIPRGLEGAWTSREALELKEVPRRLLVVGAGAIGLEIGSIYAGLGSQVTIVEMANAIMPAGDEDLARALQRRLQGDFEAIELGTTVSSLEPSGSGFRVALEGPKGRRQESFDQVLAAVGRRPATEDHGLERAGVKVDERGFIIVDEARRTSVPHIFAIGDVTKGPMLAHKASWEGKVAAEVIAGRHAAFDNRAIPNVIYTDPEVAWTGISEREARSGGLKFGTARFPLTALGRAHTAGETDGFAKVIYELETGLILGAGVISPMASELIAEWTLAIEMGATLEDVAATIHAHPTFSETAPEAVELALGVPVHVFGPEPKEKVPK